MVWGDKISFLKTNHSWKIIFWINFIFSICWYRKSLNVDDFGNCQKIYERRCNSFSKSLLLDILWSPTQLWLPKKFDDHHSTQLLFWFTKLDSSFFYNFRYFSYWCWYFNQISFLTFYTIGSNSQFAVCEYT